MALSLRHIRRRIKSVENTKKMTRAMEMVAAAKLRKLQELLRQSDRYISELKRILETLVKEKPLAHPLLEKRLIGADSKPAPTLVFVIASDTGLCGSYNTNILERMSRYLGSEPSVSRCYFVAIGRHSATYLRRTKQSIAQEFGVPRPNEIDETIRKIAQIATERFRTGEADQVIFIYTKVASLGSLKPTVEQLFPIATTTVPGTAAGSNVIDYIIEPSLDQTLDFILPEFIDAQVGQFVKHSLVAEQVSRMMAMRQATDSAREMIESLTLLRNKARQAAITKELIEVVSGSRALQIK
ncbi:MAG: ATP synthase F1 subunit gamma [Candidatus Omnitrophica bacterium]|nr:ATP synthase F1 subunit gamma [Candidatus Omnitrophota bacterium]